VSVVHCPENLTYVRSEEDGYRRVKRGRGFSYHHPSGKKIEQPEVIDRIKSLGIPPVWKNVWICPDPHGHLQATGYDPKNRKQYLYHSEWTEYRNLVKFQKMSDFGRALPEIRRRTHRELQQKGWHKVKVLSLVVQMMDEYYIRIGNQHYKEQNETFGLTTLRRKHLDFEEGVGRLEYKAKSGKYRKISIKNNQLINLVRQCSELPGYEVFTYRDENKKFQSVDSQEVNDYLHHIVGDRFSSKDFRTWGGTSLIVEKEQEARRVAAENKRRKLETTLVRLTAAALGNTVSICRNYYIHPEVIKIVTQGETQSYLHVPRGLSASGVRLLSKSEQIVLNILDKDF